MRAIDDKACLKPGCDNFGKPGINIVGHGWLTTKSDRRRRYRCKICGGTASMNTGTAYSGLRCTRREFDQVASLRVEGVSISATARLTGHSRNTIARWLERASRTAERFNGQMMRDFEIVELQADELYTFIGSKSKPTWLFATIEVCSRLWASSVVGRRSYVFGQVIKTRRNNRVIRVERRLKIGTARRLKDALLESEDSETLNTSFAERLNLTIRQGSAYLRRRSPCHARCEHQLRGHVELLRCHYNFVRPHGALKFGRETRTPAMQAGLVSRRLTLSDIFTARGLSLRLFVAVVRVFATDQPAETDAGTLPAFSWPHVQRTAA